MIDPPGELLDIGGFRLHLDQMGEGSPSVVLDAGAGGFSLVWALVQPEVARFTRVISYDRAGYGWSDPAPPGVPRTSQQAVLELHALLVKAAIPPPYVLVGHSFGGFNVRLYAHQYPQEVAGMVLIDADHEDEWTPRFPQEHRKGLQMVTRLAKTMALLARVGVPQVMARLNLMPMESIQKLPAEHRQTVKTLAYQPKSLDATGREFEGLQDSADQLRSTGSLDSLPLVVLQHSLPGPAAPGVSKALAGQIEHTAAEVQAELAQLSTRGKLVTAEQSGHDIYLDQPELVVEAIRQVVEVAREMQS